VVIENSREASYITEKLIDALRCRSIPIYWGAPDVGKIFDRAGLIECASRDDILAALRRTSAEDYDSRRAAIETNAHLADHYADMHRRAAEIIRTAI